MNIRTLRADEIECRVQQVKEGKGTNAGKFYVTLLLYKDARCDMKILDEVFGILGWKRKHDLINGRLFCTVSIFNSDTKEWIDKQDVGTESNAEAEKGQASDSFKRACVNVGIGRELYTAPLIYFELKESEVVKGTNPKTYAKFKVKAIDYDDKGNINSLVIVDVKGEQRYPKK